MTKEEIIAAVKNCAAKLGRVPTFPELQEMAGVAKHNMRRTLGTYQQTLEICGLESQGRGRRLSSDGLFQDWAGLVRQMGKIPTVTEYELHGRVTARPLRTRFRRWADVPAGMLAYAKREGLAEQWEDVLKIISEYLQPEGDRSVTARMLESGTYRYRILTNRPIYGRPMVMGPMTYAPTNEGGVIFVFGMVAHQLGFAVKRIQSDFPDCEALREVGRNRWQLVRIEFEYESRNFLTHMHPVDGCDLIVCWNHNWPECPLEVLELQNVVLPQPTMFSV
ncbi:MAG: hypothetical protein LAO78_17335 [Acidobacteriia bacterium]|nr:hypothetical protein [Terriglobia bacterium]